MKDNLIKFNNIMSLFVSLYLNAKKNVKIQNDAFEIICLSA